MSQYLRQDTESIGRRVERTGIVADSFEEIALDHADVSSRGRCGIVPIGCRSPNDDESRWFTMVNCEGNIIHVNCPAEWIQTDSRNSLRDQIGLRGKNNCARRDLSVRT